MLVLHELTENSLKAFSLLVCLYVSSSVLFFSCGRFQCLKVLLSLSLGTASMQDTSMDRTGWETLLTPTLLVWTWFRRRAPCQRWSGLSMRTQDRWGVWHGSVCMCVCVLLSGLFNSGFVPQVSLVATAPLTNLALAVRMDPSLPSKLRGLYIMGGNTECLYNHELLFSSFCILAKCDEVDTVLEGWTK